MFTEPHNQQEARVTSTSDVDVDVDVDFKIILRVPPRALVKTALIFIINNH